MSKEISRLFDLHAGQCIVTIEDANGTRSVHTIHLLEQDGSEANVQAHIDRNLAEAKNRAAKVRRVARRHGWKGKK